MIKINILLLLFLFSNILLSQNNNELLNAKYYSDEKEVFFPAKPFEYKIFRDKGTITVLLKNNSGVHIAVAESFLSSQITWLNGSNIQVAQDIRVTSSVDPTRMGHVIVKPNSQVECFNLNDLDKKYEFIDFELVFTFLYDNKFINCNLKGTKMKLSDKK